MLKVYFQICIYFFLICNNGFAQRLTYFTGGNICETKPWNLVFNDEFNDTLLDQDKWVTWYPYTSDGSDQCLYCRVTDENSQQVFLDRNVVVSNGVLKLIAKRESASWFGVTRDYTSGMIYSSGSNKFKYGKFEINCKLPTGGKGFWPAYWLFGGSGTEIDCFEFGSGETTKSRMNLSKWNGSIKSDDYGVNYDDGTDYSQGFHLFTIEWDIFFIAFYIDNKLVWKYSRFTDMLGRWVTWCDVKPGIYVLNPGFPRGEDNYLNVIADFAIWSNGGPDESTIFPNQFEIDYIRVYQRN